MSARSNCRQNLKNSTGVVRMLFARRGEISVSLKAGLPAMVRSVATKLSPDLRFLEVIAEKASEVQRWDKQTGKDLRLFALRSLLGPRRFLTQVLVSQSQVLTETGQNPTTTGICPAISGATPVLSLL